MSFRAEPFKNATEVVITDARLAAARDFFSRHGLAMANAAFGLGGPGWEGRVYGLLDALRETDSITPALGRNLAALHRLLAWGIDWPGSPHAARFSETPPANPNVVELGLLVDEFARFLSDIGVDPASQQGGA